MKQVGPMLRVLFGPSADALAWTLSEGELLSRVADLAETGFAAAPLGRVTVEALDARGRIQWCAYYRCAAELAILARQIREAREALARREGRS
jgi:hypothetical protein